MLIKDYLKRLAQPLADLKKRWALGRLLIMKLPPWVTANRVTVGRAALVIPVAMLIHAGAYWAALVTFGLAMLLDAVDGAIAEVRGQHSTLGAFLDPLADKVLVCFTLIALLDPLPMVFYLPVTLICLFAVALTLVRVLKLTMFWRKDGDAATTGEKPGDESTPVLGRASVAAKLAGKAKCWIEVVSILILLIGLGCAAVAGIRVHDTSLTWIGFCLLLAAAVLGWFSLWSQGADLFRGRKRGGG